LPVRDFYYAFVKLDFTNVRCLQAFLTLLDIEFNGIAVCEILETFTGDRAIVYEYILTRFALNESKTLGAVEPLDCSFFHGTLSFKNVFQKNLP
jgi:hypothetical protein